MLIKLVIDVVATILLLLHRADTHLAEVAVETGMSPDDLRSLRLQLVVNAGAALVSLLVATAL